MAGPHVVVLNSGGLRSLVATALAKAERPDIRVTPVHMIDGRDNADVRRQHLHKQAEFLQLPRVAELHATHLYGPGLARSADGTLNAQLAMPQMLLAAQDYARCHQAERVIWPASYNGRHQAVALAAERMQLLEHLADVGGTPMPQLQAPLLELTDQQVIELGAQMQVPWALAWSCQRKTTSGGERCGACAPCRRRHEAFMAAGIEDPIELAASVH
ncbi:MAG: 7-cyano-7-deazaguanine synthase [Phycisphaeraceae bacterium]|nr:7-cyano-7-deazaguanine synthase [Phycisphaeraceae bacterium]